MPSLATITAFYTFQQNTAARASQVNNNFEVFRGHLVSVDPNTAASSTTKTYDIGASDKRWRYGYFQYLDFDRSTSTASVQMYADPNTNTGELVFALNGSEAARISANGINAVSVNRLTSTSIISWSALTNTSTTEHIVGLDISIAANGKPLRIGLCGDETLAAYCYATDGSTSGGEMASFVVSVYRNTTTSLVGTLRSGYYSRGSDEGRWASSSFFIHDVNPGSSTNTYKFYIHSTVTSGGTTCGFYNTKSYIEKL